MRAAALTLLLTCCLVPDGWAAGSRTAVRTPLEIEIDPGRAGSLEVRIPNANLEVTGGAVDRVTVSGTMETIHRDPARARELAGECALVFRREGAVLVLEPRFPDGRSGREARKDRLWFHLRLEVPSTLALGLYTRAGDAVLKGGFHAALVVEAGRGDIRLAFAPAFRELDARALWGRVRGFSDAAIKRFYSPFGQRRLWLDPAGERTAFLRTRRGDIILEGKDTP